MSKHVKIGVASVIFNDKFEVLLGKRISPGKPGHGLWQFAGGHHEFGETLEVTAVRESKEETNLNVNCLHYIAHSEQINISPEKKRHYVTFFYLCKVKDGILKNTEPHKCEGWEWFALDKLPDKLFETSQDIVDRIITHINLYR